MPWFARAAELTSVGYVHQMIFNQVNINIPMDAGVTSDQVCTSKYFLKKIDKANELANGRIITDYANSSSAVINPITSAKVLSDVSSLIVVLQPFTITVTNVNSFNLQISASGNFTINWGDGYTQTITKTNTNLTTYSRTYGSTATRTVTVNGLATGYSNNPAIAFNNSTNRANITALSGHLGKIFPTVSGVSPRFNSSFANCTGLTSLPTKLFYGITGTTMDNMFNSTFSGCTGLTALPTGLFDGIAGAPKNNIFNSVFSGCNNIVTLPTGLFSGISGAPADSMFSNAFNGCSKISALPADLFSGVVGTPANYMFANTFANCNAITTIPGTLFSGITGNAAIMMFGSTFSNCANLATLQTGLFAGISGTPADYMFQYTFSGCGNLTGPVPTNFFGTYTGTPAVGMFAYTFYWCTKLSGAPSGMWNLTGLSNTNISSMFDGMFYGCLVITGASPSISATNSTKLWTKFSAYTPSTWNKPFTNCNNLTDYASIPATWK